MQSNVIWKGTSSLSIENCLITSTKSGVDVSSSVVGKDEDLIYQIEYFLRMNNQWQTEFLDLRIQLGDARKTIRIFGDGKGNWTKNGKPLPELEGCVDIDISTSAFTNTLPIRRLNMPLNKSQEIEVAYFDILNQQIRHTKQIYTKLDDTTYKFESPSDNFEAIISTDEDGLIIDYPELFVRSEPAQLVRMYA